MDHNILFILEFTALGKEAKIRDCVASPLLSPTFIISSVSCVCFYASDLKLPLFELA